MPTRAKKTGTSAAKKPRQSSAAPKTPKKHKGKRGNQLDPFGIDPPIIIDGGGLGNIISSPVTDDAYVVLRSAVKLESIEGDKDYPYAYRIDVDIKWMDWHGLGHKKDKSKNGKVFSLALHHTDEPR